MRKRIMRAVAMVAAVVVLAGLGGCSVPKPHFYTMSNTASVMAVIHNHES